MSQKIVLQLATIFCIVAFSFGQNNELKNLEKQIDSSAFKTANTIIEKLNKIEFDKHNRAKFNYLKGKLYRKTNQDDLSFKGYIYSKKLYAQLDSTDKVAQINIEIVSLLLAINKTDVDYNLYINEFMDYAKSNNNSKILSQGFMQLGKSFSNSNPKLALFYFKKALKENLKNNDPVYGARIEQNIGATYASDKLQKLDSAFYRYEKALKIFKANRSLEYMSYIYINKGILYTKLKDYTKAIKNFETADSIPVKENKNKNKEILYGFFANTYKQKGDYKKALEYFEKQNLYKQILDENEHKKALKEIEVNFKTKEKETENRILKSQLFQNKILLISIITLLILSIIIGSLAVKNITKKKKITEQQKQLQVQILENKLKNNELSEIDKMLEVQDKERRKIADELHDNLGSLLTTLKINFQSLKNNHNKNESIYEKTNHLIDDAYNEVRNISHLKNLGVIAKVGLLDSVKKMAYLMTNQKKTTFNVIPFGLKERLENATEILLYRIIQELCTNILKHANATEVNIYLNQHSATEFNIMIEDNGQGFDAKKIEKKSGIGLKNIEKKVEQLNGTFTIDSVISKGTTIIIDLPL